MATARLRNCSAHVNSESHGFNMAYELVSYATPVALLGVIDGEIEDINGELHDIHGMALLLTPDYDCSTTTMSHVRKFIEDYIGFKFNIADIRSALKSDNMLGNIGVSVLMVESW